MKFQPVHLLPLGLHGGMDIIAECDIGIRMSQNLTQCLNVHSRLYTASRKCVRNVWKFTYLSSQSASVFLKKY